MPSKWEPGQPKAGQPKLGYWGESSMMATKIATKWQPHSHQWQPNAKPMTTIVKCYHWQPKCYNQFNCSQFATKGNQHAIKLATTRQQNWRQQQQQWNDDSNNNNDNKYNHKTTNMQPHNCCTTPRTNPYGFEGPVGLWTGRLGASRRHSDSLTRSFLGHRLSSTLLDANGWLSTAILVTGCSHCSRSIAAIIHPKQGIAKRI